MTDCKNFRNTSFAPMDLSTFYILEYKVDFVLGWIVYNLEQTDDIGMTCFLQYGHFFPGTIFWGA